MEITRGERPIILDAKQAQFQDEINAALYQIRQALERAGLGPWQEFVLVRSPGQEAGFLVLGHPMDRSGMQEALIALHKLTVLKELAHE